MSDRRPDRRRGIGGVLLGVRGTHVNPTAPTLLRGAGLERRCCLLRTSPVAPGYFYTLGSSLLCLKFMICLFKNERKHSYPGRAWASSATRRLGQLEFGFGCELPEQSQACLPKRNVPPVPSQATGSPASLHSQLVSARPKSRVEALAEGYTKVHMQHRVGTAQREHLPSRQKRKALRGRTTATLQDCTFSL